MTEEELKGNLLDPAQWLRIFIMAVYLVLLCLLGYVLLFVIVVQAGFVLVTARPNPDLKNVSTRTVAFVFQILDYLVYGTETKPFPFSDLPRSREDLSAHGKGPQAAAARPEEAPVTEVAEVEEVEVAEVDVPPVDYPTFDDNDPDLNK